MDHMERILFMNGILLLVVAVLIGIAISNKRWRRHAIIGLIMILLVTILGGLLYTM